MSGLLRDIGYCIVDTDVSLKTKFSLDETKLSAITPFLVTIMKNQNMLLRCEAERITKELEL